MHFQQKKTKKTKKAVQKNVRPVTTGHIQKKKPKAQRKCQIMAFDIKNIKNKNKQNQRVNPEEKNKLIYTRCVDCV